MRRRLLAVCALAMAGPASAQEWPAAPEYDVLLTSYAIRPQVLRLKAGEPVKLRFVNTSNEPHRFAAGAFFARADLRGRDRETVRHGQVAVPPLSERTVALVPRAGRYPMSGAPLAQRLLGMHGRIVVE